MPQSSELAGGEGFTYEGAVAAFYMASLVAESEAPGVEGKTVHRVSVQQRDFGEPLDDVIIDFQSPTGGAARLSLQVKRSITISDAASNSDFREIIRDCWATLAKSDFRKSVDRYGLAVGTVTPAKARALTTLCELARESVEASHFAARFAAGGNAGPPVKAVRDDISRILESVKGSAPTDQELHQFLAHLVLVQYDFLHEGAVDPPSAITKICQILAPSETGKAPLIWSRLIELARASAGKSGVFDRPRLIRTLSNSARLRAAPSLESDLTILKLLAESLALSIPDDVSGTKLDRTALAAQLDQKLTEKRIVQVRGLPGSGKSVLLRQAVQRSVSAGPTLFLKGDQLEGRSWRSFATSVGLSTASLHDLLAEIAAAGTAIFYVDAIDRVEKEHQPLVLEILQTITSSPLLDNWRIVLSLRDTGIEPIRNWMGDLVRADGVGTVVVATLDDEEAENLATEKPHLRRLLFGSPQVREIVRRPFFAKILHQSYASAGAEDTFIPQSEVDLIENWWARGGYNSAGQSAIERQRAIVEIASIRARNLSQPIRLGQLGAQGIAQVSQFIEDGILQPVRPGHTVRFAHDIFFEWGFYHALTDKGDEWLGEIRACGEPPAIARVVELLSQSEYSGGQDWAGQLNRAAAAGMRSQWTRSWLLAPVGAPNFALNEAPLKDAVAANDFHFLRKLLVWFQAEKTTPNPNILASNLPRDQQLRIADLLGWPSDFGAWGRLIDFLLRILGHVPPSIYPDIVSVFEVWQNALSGVRNSRSRAVLKQSLIWLDEIGSYDRTEGQGAGTKKWSHIPELGDFRKNLANLILRSAQSEPDIAEAHLKRELDVERIREERFEETIQFSPTLSKSHPDLLVEFTLKYLCHELPDAKVAREREEARQSAEMRKKALAKPEHERTVHDQRVIDGVFSRFGFPTFDSHDWESLSIDRDLRNFWPPSPLREPFHSLFDSAPEAALRLLTTLSNYAITAWRQLHRHSHDSHGTPLPLQLDFPWGTQAFWGGDREYLWFRSAWAPKPLGSGFMALEEWCFAELSRDRPADVLIQQILKDNECIAILGVAATIAMHEDTISETVLPLVTSQRLLHADRNRFFQDLTGGFGNRMGFEASDAAHIDVIKAAEGREVRKKQLIWLLQKFYVLGNGDLSERAERRVKAFRDTLPFHYEEHRNLQAAIDDLSAQAAEFAELVDPDNYRTYKTDDPEQVAIVHVSPTASSPERAAQAESAQLRLQEGNLWAMAAKSFEKGTLVEGLTVQSAIELARRVDTPDLFVVAEQEDGGTRRGAVAASAAITLRFRTGIAATDLDWAREILRRAVDAPEQRDSFSVSSAIIPWHHSIFVSRGLAADIAAGTSKPDASADILGLIAHPLDAVALAALSEAAQLWRCDPRLSWAALFLAFTLCHVAPRPAGQPRSPRDPLFSSAEAESAIARAEQFYRSEASWPDLPLPPTPWIRMSEGAAKGRRYRHIEDEEALDGAEQDVWAEPEGFWNYQFADKVLPLIPFREILASHARPSFLSFAAGLLDWTNQKNQPPGSKPGRRDRTDTSLFEWTHELGATLGRLSGLIPFDDARDRFVTPMVSLQGEACWSLLSPFVNAYICGYILDAAIMPDGAIEILELCLNRFLSAPELDPGSYRSGEFSGFDQPRLSRHLMFITIEKADLAARYVNGDWTEINRIEPIIDRYVRAAGWAASVMGSFLTLCDALKPVIDPTHLLIRCWRSFSKRAPS